MACDTPLPPAQEEAPDDAVGAAHASTPPATLGALSVVVTSGWVSGVTSLQLASIDTLRSCREVSDFRLKVARRTPTSVYQQKFARGGGGVASSRVSLPRVVRLLYDRPELDLKPGWALPQELVGLVLGTAFGGDIKGVLWPPGLESVVFWRR